MPMIKVTILVLKGTVPSTVTGPMEILKLAGRGWNFLIGEKMTSPFDVKVISMDGNAVPCYGDIMIQPHGSARSVRSTDILIIPSLGVNPELGVAKGQKTIAWISKQHDKGAVVASICTGAFLLAETGLLDNKIATTHWGFVDSFRKCYPNVNLKPERVVTEDGSIFCGGGVNASTDLSLYLVEKYCGHQVTLEVSKALLLEPIRVTQKPFTAFAFQKKHDDSQILKIQHWLEKNYSKEFSFEEIAAQNGMSPRNFKRKFKSATGDTPLVYLHRLRIEAAKSKLEKSRVQIENISNRVGYSDIQFFRKLFKRYTGITPNAYREMAKPVYKS